MHVALKLVKLRDGPIGFSWYFGRGFGRHPADRLVEFWVTPSLLEATFEV